ncbi:protein of unknown function [Methylocaldum szegediense]|uniref:Uncharacterized protein n=1 Tax=Methylocaldum szegediense TaxID=73780 RepID=A0ABM9I2M5_9GAMM|nr:protein of unknown function [Methylocaldum szegediense]
MKCGSTPFNRGERRETGRHQLGGPGALSLQPFWRRAKGFAAIGNANNPLFTGKRV